MQVRRGNKPAPYLANVIHRLRERWPNNEIINLVCHGHSVPAGYFVTPEIRTFDSYPHLLHAALKTEYPYAEINVIVTAIGGEHSEDGERRFVTDVLRHSPQVITIDYALNDRNIGLQRAEVAWRKMIDRALENDIKVVLLTPTPDLESDYSNKNSELDLHSQQIRKLSDEYGVGLADSRGCFLSFVARGGRLEHLMAASRHPNRAGHQMVVDCLLPWFTGDVE